MPHREAFYGGAGGGGKSDALLMGALQYVDIPGYNALLLRRTFPELDKPEALLSRSHEWLDDTDALWVAGKKQWVFPSGATLTFGHMANESDKTNYKGGAYQYIGWDELTGFTETQYRYLFGWLRRLKGVDIPLRVRAASNPGDIGHEWVKERFVNPGSLERPFIKALIADNPALDRDDYLQSLAEMTPVERERIMNGNWDIMPDGIAFRREWFTFADTVPADTRKRVRTWDMATSLKTSSDYTVGGLYSRHGDTMFCEDIIRGRFEYPDTRKLIIETAKADGHYVPIGIEKAGMQLLAVQDIQATLEREGYTVYGIAADKDKFTRSLPIQRKAQAREFVLLRAGWNREYVDEFLLFSGDGKTHDDQVDTASSAFAYLFAGAGERKRKPLHIIPGAV